MIYKLTNLTSFSLGHHVHSWVFRHVYLITHPFVLTSLWRYDGLNLSGRNSYRLQVSQTKQELQHTHKKS